MIFFDQMRSFLQNLSHKEFIKWAGIYIAIITICFTAIIIRHIMTDNDLSSKLQQLNKSRTKIQQIFSEFQIIQNEKTKLDDLLKKNKNFNIQKYFQDLSIQQKLHNQAQARFASEKLPNGYIQESLIITITGMNTKQLCTLVVAMQQQPLIHINFIDIAHQASASNITVSMTIATLRSEE